MLIQNFPKLTVIMRGYRYEEAMTIIEMLTSFEQTVGVEVTTNNEDYLKIISDGINKYGDYVPIGVGTITTLIQAKSAIQNGAKFMLGPHQFNQEILDFGKEHGIISVPAAMSPSEIAHMFQAGADIVKVFPAVTVGSTFFSQLRGPYGDRPLMAVGGISIENAAEFMANGAQYLGVGSSMFDKEDIENQNKDGLRKAVKKFMDIINQRS